MAETPAPLTIPNILMRETLDDVCTLVEKHLPAANRATFIWRHSCVVELMLAGSSLDKAAHGRRSNAAIRPHTPQLWGIFTNGCHL